VRSSLSGSSNAPPFVPKGYNLNQDAPHQLIAVALCHEPIRAASDRNVAHQPQAKHENQQTSNQSRRGVHDVSFAGDKPGRMAVP
jgi:hypothetical protein